MTRFGIEEEFQLLDEDTLIPLPLGSDARAALPSGAGPANRGTVTTEFLTSQVEFSTSPVRNLDAAKVELNAFRGELREFAERRHAIAAASGTPFGVGPAGSVSASERYDTIAHWLGHIADGHHVNALHVHVEVPEADDRVRALNAVRPWMPTLLALSGNSPFADGHDTGHESWRTVIMRRFPLAGCPPHFHDIEHYRTAVSHLVAQHVIPDIASVCWAARLSERFPTVELRIFDAQLTTEDTVFLAALGRALVETALVNGARVDGATEIHAAADDGDAIHASVWAAARQGLGATLVHPATGTLISAGDSARLLLRTVTPALAVSGDLEFVTDHVDRILHTGTGARRQRAAYEKDGLRGLRELLRHDSETRFAA